MTVIESVICLYKLKQFVKTNSHIHSASDVLSTSVVLISVKLYHKEADGKQNPHGRCRDRCPRSLGTHCGRCVDSCQRSDVLVYDHAAKKIDSGVLKASAYIFMDAVNRMIDSPGLAYKACIKANNFCYEEDKKFSADLPLTFSLPPTTALICLGAIYVTGSYSGNITAVLVNTPGTSDSLFMTLDGYPMTLKGEGLKAIGVTTLSAFAGGMVRCLVLHK